MLDFLASRWFLIAVLVVYVTGSLALNLYYVRMVRRFMREVARVLHAYMVARHADEVGDA